MKKYQVIVYPINCEGGVVSWGADFATIKGCGGAGTTPDEAVKEAFENLEIHLEAMKKEGIKIPEEFNEQEYSGKFTTRISPKLHKKVAECALSNGISQSAKE